MNDFLYRDEAPLSQSEWDQIDSVVTETARRVLVGRRFINVVGPFGAGLQEVPTYVFTEIAPAVIDVIGEEDPNPIRANRRLHPVIPIIYKDFWLFWRDVETSRRFGIPLNLSAAAAAAAYVAQKEDDLILNGNQALGYAGLTTVEGRQQLPRRDWAEMGSAFADAVAAICRRFAVYAAEAGDQPLRDEGGRLRSCPIPGVPGATLQYEPGFDPAGRDAVARELGVRKFFQFAQGDRFFWDLVRDPRIRGPVEAVIGAFQDVLTPEGTLVLPALSYDEIGPDQPRFDVLRTKSCVGLIPETFRTMPGVRRSLHPTHSVAAWGRWPRSHSPGRGPWRWPPSSTAPTPACASGWWGWPTG